MAILIADARLGSDATGDGSVGNPYRTVAESISRAVTGDTVQLRGQQLWVATTAYAVNSRVIDLTDGIVYRCTAAITGGGGPSTNGANWTRDDASMYQEWVRVDKGIILENYPGEIPVINGDNFTLPVRGNGGQEGQDSYIIPGGTVEEYTYRGLVRAEASNVTVRGVLVSESLGRGLQAQNTFDISNVSFINNYVRMCRHNAVVTENVSDILIDGINTRQTGLHTPFARPVSESNWPQAISTKYTTDLILRNCNVSEHWGEGIGITNNTDGAEVYDNVIFNNYNSQLYLHRCQNTNVYRNLIFETPGAVLGNASNPVISINNEDKRRDEEREIDNCTIRNNLLLGGAHNIRNQGGQGGQFPFNAVTIEDNTMIAAIEESIFIAAQAIITNYVIRNNTVIEGTDPTSAISQYNGSDDIAWGPNNWSVVPIATVSNGGDVIGVTLVNPVIPTDDNDFDVANYYHQAVSLGRDTAAQVNVTDYLAATRDNPTDYGALDADATDNIIAAFTASSSVFDAAVADGSIGDVDTWLWDWGDGSANDTGQFPPTHTYAVAGTYTITLTVTGPVGTDSTTQTVVIAGGQTDVACTTNQNGSFTRFVSMGSNDSGVLNGTWNNVGSLRAGDRDATKFDDRFAITFEDLTLDATDTLVNAVMILKSRTKNGTNPQLIIFGELDANPTHPVSQADFDGRTLTTASVAWNPGDVTLGTLVTTPDLSAIVTEIIALAGWTTGNSMTFFVFDNQGAGFNAENRISFNSVDEGDGPQLRVEYSCNAIQADFEPSSTIPAVGQQVDFTDQSTGTVTSYLWDFGNGVTSTQQNPSHSYASAGTSTVTLTVTGPDGTSTTTQTVTVADTLTLPADVNCSGVGGSGGFTRIVESGGNDSTRIRDNGESTWTNQGSLFVEYDGTAGGLQNRDDFMVTFENVTIPAGATIQTATLQLYVLNNAGPIDPFAVDVYTVLLADQPHSTSLVEYEALQTQTTGSGVFADIPLSTTGYIDIPNLSSLVQQVVDLPGWVSGNRMSFGIYDLGGDEGNLTIASYDDNLARAPRLVITYACDTTATSEGPARGASEFVIDSAGNVTQLSAHPEPINRLLGASAYNYLRFYNFSFNIFTGLGQATEPCGCTTLLFNIDTGNWQIVDTAGNVISTGANDANLRRYGLRHPVNTEFGTVRGQAFWEWSETEHATHEAGYTAQAWPALFELQYQKAISL